MEDDIYPNEGEAFTLLQGEPLEQQQARTKEKSQVLKELPILKKVIERLEERIIFYGTVDSIPPQNRDNEKIFMRHWDAHQLTRDNLRSEKEELEALIDDYIKA